MEGPSLVIAKEEFAPFIGKKIQKAEGSAKLPWERISGQKLIAVEAWGKHFLLLFKGFTLRIHFLMFGSYRIDHPRENRIPKMKFKFANGEIYFYSCAIRILEEDIRKIYDWSTDVMSSQWNHKQALKAVRAKPNSEICDVLMDQEIFSGLGNIIKNEVLWRQHVHPEARVEDLPAQTQRAIVKDARDYSLQFYEWKKIGQLKRNWKIFRKRTCPRCELPVEKRATGKGQRMSHFCENCQELFRTATNSNRRRLRKQPKRQNLFRARQYQ
jgi:endonuclease-8